MYACASVEVHKHMTTRVAFDGEKMGKCSTALIFCEFDSRSQRRTPAPMGVRLGPTATRGPHGACADADRAVDVTISYGQPKMGTRATRLLTATPAAQRARAAALPTSHAMAKARARLRVGEFSRSGRRFASSTVTWR